MSIRRINGWWLRPIVAALVGLMFTPVIVLAHSKLKRSEPSANQRLAVPPVMLRLWFSEAPGLAMTTITLTDSAGQVMGTEAIERDETDKLAVRVRVVQALKSGRYTVSWRTAATDGHPTSGSFSFTVLASAAQTESAGVSSSSGAVKVEKAGDTRSSMVVHRETDSPLGMADIGVRVIRFVCLFVVIGTVVFQFAVLRRALPGVGVAGVIARRVATVGAFASLLLSLVAIARLILQAQIFNANRGTISLSLGQIVGTTRWGTGWLIEMSAAVVASLGFLVARKTKQGWVIAAAMATVLSITPALGGHAAASARFTSLAIITDALHVFGASGWLGSLFILVLVAIPSVMMAATEDHWRQIASLVNAFSPSALLFAGLVVITGAISAWLHLGSVRALWTSDYGRVLLLKVAVLSTVAGTGAYNWRRVRPSLGTEAATRRLQRSAAVELIAGAFVVCITAVLVAMEPPVQ